MNHSTWIYKVSLALYVNLFTLVRGCDECAADICVKIISEDWSSHMFIDEDVSRYVYIISLALLITLITLYSVHVVGLKLRTVEQTIA
jgi:hypothetical protein